MLSLLASLARSPRVYETDRNFENVFDCVVFVLALCIFGVSSTVLIATRLQEPNA